MRRLLVIIVLLINALQFLYAQWERLSNVPVDTFLTDIGPIFFCNFYDIHFINHEVGFVAGGRFVPGVSRGYVYKTEDSGLSWNISLYPEVGYCPLTVTFYNNSGGLVSCVNEDSPEGHTILHSSDTGTNWQPIHSVSTEDFVHDIFFINETRGYLLTSKTIQKTNDSGRTWFVIFDGEEFHGKEPWEELRTMCYISDSKLWAADRNGSIYTYDGSHGWSTTIIDSTYNFLKIHFIDEDNGWVGGGGRGNWWGPYNPILLRTNNGGETWEDITNMKYLIRDLCFFNKEFGWAVAEDSLMRGYVLETNDGGETWKECFVNELGPLNRIYYVDNTGWAAGEGTIVMFSDTVGQIPRRTCQKNAVILDQNQPNPFRSRTIISYQLPVVDEVELNVYDIYCRRVAILVREKQPADRYEVEWNAEGMNPGIYFCELKTGLVRRVIKMILN